MNEKIAVFGSAFNPPSLGHASVLARLSHFDEVFVVPSIAHAWGKSMLDYQTRCELIELFLEDLMLSQKISNVQLCRVEQQILEEMKISSSDEPNQSVTTFAVLEKLAQQYPKREFTFVMGPDNLLSFDKFYKAEEILQRWSVLTCPQTLDVRSTDIRNALEGGDLQVIDVMTTPKVSDYLVKHRLYLK